MNKTQSTEPKQVNADHLHELSGENEGIRSSSPDQMSVFDGSGRESVVVLKQGTGESAAKEPMGEGFYPPPR